MISQYLLIFVQNILRQFVASSKAALKLSDINIDRNGHNPKWNSYFDMQLILELSIIIVF